jgi:hypothetical protein
MNTKIKELVSHMMLFILLIEHIFVDGINSFISGDVVGTDDTLVLKKSTQSILLWNNGCKP